MLVGVIAFLFRAGGTGRGTAAHATAPFRAQCPAGAPPKARSRSCRARLPVGGWLDWCGCGLSHVARCGWGARRCAWPSKHQDAGTQGAFLNAQPLQGAGWRLARDLPQPIWTPHPMPVAGVLCVLTTIRISVAFPQVPSRSGSARVLGRVENLVSTAVCSQNMCAPMARARDLGGRRVEEAGVPDGLQGMGEARGGWQAGVGEGVYHPCRLVCRAVGGRDRPPQRIWG
eukprot:1597826-Prymnesium_polylepis.1